MKRMGAGAGTTVRRTRHRLDKAALHAALHSPASGARCWGWDVKSTRQRLVMSSGHATDVFGKMPKTARRMRALPELPKTPAGTKAFSLPIRPQHLDY